MSDLPLSENSKTHLRHHALRIRQNLVTEALSVDIQNRLAGWEAFRNAETVLFYHPFRGEIDLLPLAEAFPCKHWFLPGVLQEDSEGMCFRRYQPGQKLTPDRYGVPSPDANAEALDTSTGTDILVLVPGLSFDRSGYRLGYGKGYYDRFLSKFPEAKRVGIVPMALLVESLPHDDWDIPMHYLASEAGVHPCGFI